MRCLMFVCLLICSLPSLALDRSRVEGYLLPNGLQVILKSGYERDHVAIRLVVGVGLDDFDCEQKELPHLLEHLLFGGIDETGEGGLEERLQSLGGEWNAYTSSADTTFVIEAPARNQRKVLDLLLAVIRDTRIDANSLATAKRIIEREDGGHYGHLQRWLDRQDIGHPASDQLATELGLKCPERSNLDDMTLEQVQALRDRWYAANNMTLIMVGGLDRLLPAYLDRTFGELPATEPEERRTLESISQQAERRRYLTRGVLGDSAKLHWLFIEPVLDNDHQQTLDLLSRYLDWALYDQLRLRNGLSYGPRYSAKALVTAACSASMPTSNATMSMPRSRSCSNCSTTCARTASTRIPSPASRMPPLPRKAGAPRQQRAGRLLLGRAQRLHPRAFRRPCAQAAPGHPDAGQRGAEGSAQG